MTAPQRACAQMEQAKLKLNTVQKAGGIFDKTIF